MKILKILLMSLFVNASSNILDPYYDFIFKKILSSENLDVCFHIINGNLVVIGSCNMEDYSKIIKIGKMHYKSKFYDVLKIDNLSDNHSIPLDDVDYVKKIQKKYLIKSKNFKKLFLHKYKNILYIIVVVKDQYEKNYFLKLGELIKEECLDSINQIEYCFL